MRQEKADTNTLKVSLSRVISMHYFDSMLALAQLKCKSGEKNEVDEKIAETFSWGVLESSPLGMESQLRASRIVMRNEFC